MSQQYPPNFPNPQNQQQQYPPQPSPYSYPSTQQQSQPPVNYPPVKPLPPGWQQPITPQWNPSGVYGGEPEPKKKIPWWVWLVAGFVVLVIIGAIANLVNPTTSTTTAVTRPTATPQDQPVAVAPPRPTLVPTRVYAKPTPTPTLDNVLPTLNALMTEAALNPEPTETLAPTPAPTRVPVPAVALSVNGWRFQKVIEYNTAKANYTYFIVDFTVKNNSHEPLDVSPIYITVQSRKGFSYEYGSMTYLLPKAFKSTTLAPGEMTRGEIAFEVPTDEVLISGKFEDYYNKVTVPIG